MVMLVLNVLFSNKVVAATGLGTLKYWYSDADIIGYWESFIFQVQLLLQGRNGMAHLI